MKHINESLIIEACKDLYARDKNHGCYVDGKIPDSFVKIRDQYFPELTDDSWSLTVEFAVKYHAVHMVAKQNDE